LISANRNRDAYAAFGARVLLDADDLEPYAGPLAGLRAALAICTTPWLAVVPCDVPHLPPELVPRLAAGVTNAPAAVAAVEGKMQPLCCLLDVALAPALESALASGERKAARWLERVCAVLVPFADAPAFVNINGESQLAAARQPHER
jgi:molybdopterin-guanine dinucleotide biosynthesis protein A